MKVSLFFLIATALGANAATQYLCWCTVDGAYNEHYTKQACWRKYHKYMKNNPAKNRNECWIKPGDDTGEWAINAKPWAQGTENARDMNENESKSVTTCKQG
ncbi:hypothetical protein CcaCcLH18_14171 [Colletotrichum camelliae]|nr:hypothetical protein CcaCcLH18_14171 [Colletotrichum camelliae]